VVNGDLVVLVDEMDRQMGIAGWEQAHDKGLLHRAVSVLLSDPEGRLLIQRRAHSKRTFPGLWGNTVCTHPRPGEDLIEAGRRRLREELGIDAELTHAGRFVYEALDPASSLREAELDHVLVGTTAAQLTIDPVEVAEVDRVDPDELRRRIATKADLHVPWLAAVLDVALAEDRP
jgi:isopentenyl-diphosphate Delta-isomerase